MSTGDSHPRISLLICEHRPPHKKYSRISNASSDSNDRKQTFATVDTLPYGLRVYSVNELEKKCLEHIEAISNWKDLSGDSETLSGRLLRAVCRFEEADQSAQEVFINPTQEVRVRILLPGRMAFYAEPSWSIVYTISRVSLSLLAKTRHPKFWKTCTTRQQTLLNFCQLGY